MYVQPISITEPPIKAAGPGYAFVGMFRMPERTENVNPTVAAEALLGYGGQLD